jgi:hypothetical protein
MVHPHQNTPEDISVIGVDIGKDVFHLVGFDSRGKIAFRRKIKRLADQAAFSHAFVSRRGCPPSFFRNSFP